MSAMENRLSGAWEPSTKKNHVTGACQRVLMTDGCHVLAEDGNRTHVLLKAEGGEGKGGRGAKATYQTDYEMQNTCGDHTLLVSPGLVLFSPRTDTLLTRPGPWLWSSKTQLTISRILVTISQLTISRIFSGFLSPVDNSFTPKLKKYLLKRMYKRSENR